MAHIFVSYAREDIEMAKGVVDLLQSEGFDVWWDHKLRGGEHYPTRIKDIIKNCAHVIVLWSNHSVASEWVQLEAREAKSKLVPLQISSCELPGEFRELHTIQFKEWPQVLRELYSVIRHGRQTFELDFLADCHQSVIHRK